MQANTSTKVVTGKVRASYVNAFQPRLNELSGKEEYSLTLLVPKEDKDTSAKLKSAMEAAIAAKWNGKTPAGLQKPVHDGDGEKPNGGEYGEECRGHWVLNVKSNKRPGIIDAAMNDVIDPNEFVSGDYCRVSLGAYAYDNMRKGVSFGLNNIQVLAKGDPLGGTRSRPQDDFTAVASQVEDWGDDAPF